MQVSYVITFSPPDNDNDDDDDDDKKNRFVLLSIQSYGCSLMHIQDMMSDGNQNQCAKWTNIWQQQ